MDIQMPMLIVNSDSSDIGLYTNSEKLLTKKTFVLIMIQINLLVEISTRFSHKKNGRMYAYYIYY